jgi:hypothetical protein
MNEGTVMPTPARRIALALTLALAACAGGSQAARQGLPPSAPDWVVRGSRIVDGGMVGVGSVRGIANAPLAQDTARSRARAEIAKMLEVYSASLMKDYQASTTAGSASDEAQQVEQAIKTFSAQLLQGTEQKDMWLDDETGTWFALVALDFEKSRAVAATAARMDGGLRQWVEDNGDRVLSDLEADMAERRRPAPAPAEAEPPPATPAPARDEEDVASGARPAWIDGACARDRYLCGVGDGASVADADAAARGALALIFEANVRTVTESFQSAAREVSSRTGETWREVEEVKEHALVTSEKLVPMSEIRERWRAPEGRVWSLAIVERARAARALEEQIRSLDASIARELERARGAARELDRLPILRRALTALGEREAKNADLRVVRPSGRGLPSPVSVQDVLALIAGTRRELRFGLALAGAGALRLRDCLEAALTEAGHRLEAVEVDDDGRRAPRLRGAFDVLVEGVVRTTPRGRIRGSEVVQANLTLRIKNGQTGRTLRTLTGSEKGTRPTREGAASTAAFKVCQDRVPAMVKEVDRAFGR